MHKTYTTWLNNMTPYLERRVVYIGNESNSDSISTIFEKEVEDYKWTTEKLDFDAMWIKESDLSNPTVYGQAIKKIEAWATEAMAAFFVRAYPWRTISGEKAGTNTKDWLVLLPPAEKSRAKQAVSSIRAYANNTELNSEIWVRNYL